MNGFTKYLLFLTCFLAFVKISCAQSKMIDSYYQWKEKDNTLLPALTGVTTLSLAHYFQMKENLPNHGMSLKPWLSNNNWDETKSDYSSYLTYGTTFGVFSLYQLAFLKRNSKVDWNTTAMITENILFERLLVANMKSLQLRARPFVENGVVNEDFIKSQKGDAYMSFYSAHTSLMFSNAYFWYNQISLLDLDNKKRDIIRVALYTIAGVVAHYRYQSGQHYLSDVFAGALIGTGVSWLNLKLHKATRLK